MNHRVRPNKQMYGLEDDDRPEESEAPDIMDVIKKLGLNEIMGPNEPVERGKGRGCVICGDRGFGAG